MKKQLQRIISMALVLCMVLSLVPGEAAAYFVPGMDNASQDYTGEITVLNEDGSTDTVEYDESWEEVYPYGAFVFGNYEASVTEGSEDGSTVTIPVYRLGGTTGRATAYIHYQPVMTQDSVDSMTYAYAASGLDDVVIEVEDPQPVAQYQPVGMDHIYAGCELNVEQGIEDGAEADYQVISLAEDVQADEYVWQQAVVKITEEGDYELIQSWMSLETDSAAELKVDNDIWFSSDACYDFRCLYTVGGKTYCTATAWEVPFNEDSEELEDMPADLELNAEPTYTALSFESAYDDCVFELTFAENEWVKNIVVTVQDDELPELPEMGMFTLIDSYGGEVFDAANTLTLLVNDNDPHEPSQLGFKATSVEADQDSGSVTVTVERTGGTTYPVSVEYKTVSGTAEAGKQFSNTSGTLMFAGDVTSIDIKIPLVAEEERTEALEFSVVLSELKGGGEDYACTLENDTVTVSLTSSGKAVGLESGLNLASVLATASGEDVSAGSSVGEALLPEATTVTGSQDTTIPPEIVGTYVEGSGNSRTYNYQSGIQLRREQYVDTENNTKYSDNYWNDWENVIGSKGGDSSGNVNYYTDFRNVTFVESEHKIEEQYGGPAAMKVFEKSSSGIKLRHNNSTEIGTCLSIEKNAGVLFDKVEYRFEWNEIGVARAARDEDDYLYVMPLCRVGTKKKDAGPSDFNYTDYWTGNASRFTNSNSYDWITCETSHPTGYGTKSYSLPLDEELLMVSVDLVLNKNGSQSHSPSASDSDQKRGANGSSTVELTKLFLERRVFSNTSTIGLTVHTANDVNDGLDASYPYAMLDDSTGVYTDMRPSVSLVAGQSGVNSSGNLYVGSRLKVSLKNTASYFVAESQKLNDKNEWEDDVDFSLYITNSKGEKKNAAVTCTDKKNKTYTIEMMWDGMTDADLSDTYTINVVMQRKQSVTLNFRTSLGDSPADDHKAKVLNSVNGVKVSYAYSEFEKTAAGDFKKFSVKTVETTAESNEKQIEIEENATEGTILFQGSTTVGNLQCINFGLDPKDIIVFHSRSYAGNEWIYLSMADLASPSLIFDYYHRDALSIPTTMKATITATALYYDGNGNGQIDGYYNTQTGYFVVDESSGDRNLGFTEGEFDETNFQPVVDSDGTVHQYFLKVFYNMNAKCLQPPTGAKATDTAMVLPLLMSTITDSKAYSELTTQQRSYRYLQAGSSRSSADGAYADSSRGHIMYGEAASATSFVDIPLGGDKSPVSYTLETTADGLQTKVYHWEPDYVGSLLLDYDDPDPVNHEKNITGQTIAIAGEEPTWKSEGKKRTMTLSDAGKAKVNAYLGALTGDTTFGLAVQETIDQSAPYAAVTGFDQIKVESVTVGNVKAIPNGEYLANTEGSGSPDAAQGGSGGESAMSEFEVDLGVTLPSTDLALGDYATIVMDGSSVGLSIGLPIASVEENPSGKVDWGEELKNANDGINTMKNFASGVLNGTGVDTFKEIMGDDSYNDAKGGKSSSRGFEFSMSVAFTILFEYNPIDNTYYFKQAALAASVGFEFTVQYRFTLVPILYIYLKTGLEVSVATGFSVARTAKEGNKIATSDWLNGVAGVTSKGLGVSLAKGESACFVVDISNVRGFHLYMNGNVYMEVLRADQVEQYKQNPNGYSGKYVASGRLSSDGEEPVEVFLEDGKYRAYVVLTALETTTVFSAVEVTGAKSLVYWDGLQFAPGGFIEVGAGVGVELLKFELYLRASMKLAFTIGGYSVDAGSYRGAKLDNFDFTASLGFNVTVLFINYSMDLIGYYLHIEDTGDGRKVDSDWGAFGGALGSKAGSAGSTGSLVSVSAPTNTSDTQRVAGEGSNSRAYDPTDDNAPFQLSGYGASGDGFKLMEGLSTGNSYQVLRVGAENYILYTQSRSVTENALDTPQLVLSKVVLTGPSGTTRLQNPLNSSETCLVVDNDASGDLDYSYSVDGDTLTVIWTSYNEASGEDVDATDAAAASRRTVVKTASIDLSGTDGFTTPTVLTDAIGDFRYLPQQEGSVSIYAEGSGADDQSASLKAYLMAAYGMTEEEAEGGTMDYNHAAAVYRWNYQSDLNAMYGSANRLVAGEAEAQLSTGEVIENIETTTVDGIVYAAYSTVQYAYFDQDGLTTTTIDENCDLASIKRLYLRSFDGEQWGEAKLLQTAIDFDRCNNNGAFGMTDGVYSGGALESEQLDPYFSNLKFLNAKLSSSESVQTVFLYEMGGNTYLINQTDLLSAAQGGSFTCTPIFTAAEGTDAVIASDDSGNLAVVYTAPMNATGSNALYVSWWDTNLNQWGIGNVLAMNHLQVYEDAARYGLSAEELELAYLGKTTGNDEYDAYIASAGESAKGEMEQLTFSNLQITLTGGGDSGSQLLVLTQGSLQELTDTEVYNPLTKATTDEVKPDGDPSMGFYAVSFGAGKQSVGQARLNLKDYDFTAGSKLAGTLSFTNNGTTAIRASSTEPATVTLIASGAGYNQTIAEWSITESIPSGAAVELDFQMTGILLADLPENTVFSATVSEDEAYISASGGTAFTASTGELLKVGKKPELQIEGFDMKLIDISNGEASFQVDMTVSNRGNENADDIFLQFSYEKKDGELAEYYPLNITKNSFEVGAESAASRAVGNDLEKGIFSVGSIRNGYQRSIDGTLSIPISCFRQDEISGLHIKAEVFSGEEALDTMDKNGLYIFSHSNEYSGSNNVWSEEIGHETLFYAPSRISMAMGNTLHLPISCSTTSSTGAEISVKEIGDGTGTRAENLGILHYDPASKTIVAAPDANTAGKTGIIQVEDQATNSIYAIAYTITELGSGINIYRDDESFTFYEADGSLTDTSSKQEDWQFSDNVPGWDGGSVASEAPMNNDTVSATKSGASVTFTTVADTMTLWFIGEVTVSSTLPGFTPVTESRKIGESYITFSFGNDAGASHTVTITAKAGTVLDRYTATYSEAAEPVQSDSEAPQIFWSRSFPDTASLEPGSSVTLTCCVVDDSQLLEVSGIPEGTVINKTSGRFWSFPVTVTENGKITIKAKDSSGKTTSYPVRVDWFNSPVTIGAIGTAPDFPAVSVAVQDEAGNPITGPLPTDAYPYVYCSYVCKAGETITVTPGDGGTAIKPEEDGRWKITENGVYLVRVTAADGTWTQVVLVIDCIDDGTFTIGVTDDAAEQKLTVTVGESKLYTLTGLTVNGYSIFETQTFSYTLGGTYTVTATNSQGRTVSTTVTTNVPLRMDDDAITTTGCTSYNVQDGTVAVSLQGIHGGWYDEALFTAGTNTYQATYTAALLPVSDETAAVDETALNGADWSSADAGSFRFAGLAHGWYRVAVRDSEGNTCIGDAFYVNNGLSLTVTDDPEARKLNITVDSQDPLTLLTVNDYSILDQTKPYTFPYTLGGVYSVHAENTVGGGDYVSVTVGVPLTLDRYAVSTSSCSTRIRHDGTVTLRLSGVQGGSYDEAASTPAENIYQATYTAALIALRSQYALPDADALADAKWVSAANGAFRFDLLSAGWYQLNVRDTGGNTVSLRVLVNIEGSEKPVVVEEPEHGTIIVTPEEPETGEEVVIIAKPDDGYALGDLTVKDENGSELPLTKREDGSYVFIMPDGTVVIRATFVPIAFRDVTKSDYFYDAVLWAVENGITNGTGEGIFSPHLECTRAQAVTFLGRAAGSPAPRSSDMPFADVASGSYYYDAVLWAVEKGITKGTSDTAFSPDAICTRAQIVTFLWRSQGSPAATSGNPFADVDTTDYYAKAVSWAVKNGITTGTGDTTFAPDAICTRAQIVTFLYRNSQ